MKKKEVIARLEHIAEMIDETANSNFIRLDGKDKEALEQIIKVAKGKEDE